VGDGDGIPTKVERALNEMRLAVLGILVGIGLTVGFGVPCPWWAQIVAGVSAFAMGCVLIKWTFSRQLMMRFMHWLTGH